jgi:hypothetical protein
VIGETISGEFAMKTTEVMTRLMHLNVPGPRVSMYVPLEGTHLSRQLLKGLRATALRLLDGQDEALAGLLTRGDLFSCLKEVPSETKGLAIFLASGFKEVVPLPLRIPPRVVVSRSFHLKPMKYAQKMLQNSYLLHFNPHGASLVEFNLFQSRVIETYLPPVNTPLPDAHWDKLIPRNKMLTFLDGLSSVTLFRSPLIVSSAPEGPASSVEFWARTHPEVTLDGLPFGCPGTQALAAARAKVKELQRSEVKRSLELVLKEDYLNEPHLILERLIEGKITKLLVSLEAMRWGSIDLGERKIDYRKMQMDHADEDVLDDLLEIAMQLGVEADVVAETEMPGGQSILAS